MNSLRTIIVDDEPLAREAIAAMLQQSAGVEVVGQYADGGSAVEAIRRVKPDLAFLDVQMPDLNGFEVVEALRPEERPAIIFVTAYDQHAIRAFELAVVDYLLKPFSDRRFQTALDRVKTRAQLVNPDDAQARFRRLFEFALGKDPPKEGDLSGRQTRLSFKVGPDHYLVNASEIVWIEAQGDFVKVRVEGQIHRVRETLQAIEQRLDPDRFSRVHRSFLVNIERIRKVSTGMGGELTLVMSDGTKVPVSRGCRTNVVALMDG